MELNNFIVVREDGEGVLGKLVYFSLGSILIDRETFNRIGEAMDVPKSGVSRTSVVDAFKSATGDLYDRQVIPSPDGTKIVKVYCRDNDRSDKSVLRRELVLETLQAQELTLRANRLKNCA